MELRTVNTFLHIAELPSCRAVREKLCSSAICKKVLMVRSSTAVPLSGG